MNSFLVEATGAIQEDLSWSTTVSLCSILLLGQTSIHGNEHAKHMHEDAAHVQDHMQ